MSLYWRETVLSLVSNDLIWATLGKYWYKSILKQHEVCTVGYVSKRPFLFFSLKPWVRRVRYFFLKEWAILQSDPLLVNRGFLLSWGPNRCDKALIIYKFKMYMIASSWCYRIQYFLKELCFRGRTVSSQSNRGRHFYISLLLGYVMSDWRDNTDTLKYTSGLPEKSPWQRRNLTASWAFEVMQWKKGGR